MRAKYPIWIQFLKSTTPNDPILVQNLLRVVLYTRIGSFRLVLLRNLKGQTGQITCGEESRAVFGLSWLRKLVVVAKMNILARDDCQVSEASQPQHSQAQGDEAVLRSSTKFAVRGLTSMGSQVVAA